VLFLGDRSDIPELLPGLDLFVMSSVTEGYSIALLEACASGLPIVATNVGGNAEIVRDGVNGKLVTNVRRSSWLKPSWHCLPMAKAPGPWGALAVTGCLNRVHSAPWPSDTHVFTEFRVFTYLFKVVRCFKSLKPKAP
jgi:hypothetical protein